MSGLPRPHDRRPWTAVPPGYHDWNTTNTFGCAAESVIRAIRPSRSCPIGSLRRVQLALLKRSAGVRASPQVIPWSKRRRTAKIRHARPIHPLCADGHYRRLSACACWVKKTSPITFYGSKHQSLRGIWPSHALPYSAHRGKKSVNREAIDDLPRTDSLDGLSARAGLAPGAATRWMGLCPLHGDHNRWITTNGTVRRSSIYTIRGKSARRRCSRKCGLVTRPVVACGVG